MCAVLVFSLRCHASAAFSFFFFNDPATTEIYTLSLHDALPIYRLRVRSALRSSARRADGGRNGGRARPPVGGRATPVPPDRKSTRLNSSHQIISYAVFCFKKKKSMYTNEKT